MGLFGAKEKCTWCDGNGYTITKSRDSSDGNTWQNGCGHCGGAGRKMLDGIRDHGQFTKEVLPYRDGTGWVSKKQ